MAFRDAQEIRNSSWGRSLLLARDVAAGLHTEGWTVREGAAHAAGTADAVAEKSWVSKDLEVRLRLVVRCHHGAERILFSRSAIRDNVLHVCDDPPIPPALLARAGLDPAAILARIPERRTVRVAPPRARAAGYAFREPGGGNEPFRVAAEEVFGAAGAIDAELRAYDADVLADDLDALTDPAEKADHAIRTLTALGRRTELLHGVVVTDAALWTVADEHRIARVPLLRLHRSRVASAERTWIDIVQADAFARFAQSATRHYANAMTRRGLRVRV